MINSAYTIVFVSTLCLSTIKAVEIYTTDRNGKPIWQDSSEMRDRSIVPRPSLQDKISYYRRRNKIPVPEKSDYRTRSSIPVPDLTFHKSPSDMIPRPSLQDIVEDYRRRSGIPESQKVSAVKNKEPNRRAASRTFDLNQKKSLINRILFSLPIGAQFPIYFSSRSRKGSNKKSEVAMPAQRFRIPYRSQTWGLPINYKALENSRYLMPYIKQQTIARQQIVPGMKTAGYRKGYYIPKTFLTSQLLSNRNVVPLFPRNRGHYLGPRSQYFLNRVIRSYRPLKKLTSKDVEQSRKAVIDKALT